MTARDAAPTPEDRRYETAHTINCADREPHPAHYWTTKTQTTHRCGGRKPTALTPEGDPVNEAVKESWRNPVPPISWTYEPCAREHPGLNGRVCIEPEGHADAAPTPEGVVLGAEEREALAFCPRCGHLADHHSGPHGPGCLTYVADMTQCPCLLIERHANVAAVEHIIAARLAAERAAHEGLRAAVEALADGWECEPNPSDYHVKACPGCNRAARLRAVLAAGVRGG